jgi:hypothetical protein
MKTGLIKKIRNIVVWKIIEINKTFLVNILARELSECLRKIWCSKVLKIGSVEINRNIGSGRGSRSLRIRRIFGSGGLRSH